jgi:hypothetical protein
MQALNKLTIVIIYNCSMSAHSCDLAIFMVVKISMGKKQSNLLTGNQMKCIVCITKINPLKFSK